MWNRLPCSKAELRLDITLVCGQSFRWQEVKPGEWRSVLAGRIWTLTQTDDAILYHVIGPEDTKQEDQKEQVPKLIPQLGTPSRKTKLLDKPQAGIDPDSQQEICPDTCQESETILSDYFQLNVNLTKLYSQWSVVDGNFEAKASDFTGVRILRQDPVENLFSFICSSNNNISRISLMVDRMCQKYGQKLGEVDGVEYHSFPSVDDLARPSVEQELRNMGFGYRAKFITQSADYIKQHGGLSWLTGLREKTYEEAKAELMKLSGVGAKVADCVCLMSLDKPGAIPVDTHVWQIVTRDYNLTGVSGNKTITEKIYNQIGEFFRDLWGSHAGWAQSVLFSADLKKFQKPKESVPKKRKSPAKTKEENTSTKVKKDNPPKSRRKKQK